MDAVGTVTGIEGGEKLAFQVIKDPSMAKIVQQEAPTAKVGTSEAAQAFAGAVKTLKFKTDGDGPASKYGLDGKTLDPNGGGRTDLVEDMAMVGGKTAADAHSIASGHFIKMIQGDTNLKAPDLAGKIREWKADNPVPK
jgi:hypothetical protein